jgi:hypothetical protein
MYFYLFYKGTQWSAAIYCLFNCFIIDPVRAPEVLTSPIFLIIKAELQYVETTESHLGPDTQSTPGVSERV